MESVRTPIIMVCERSGRARIFYARGAVCEWAVWHTPLINIRIFMGIREDLNYAKSRRGGSQNTSLGLLNISQNIRIFLYRCRIIPILGVKASGSSVSYRAKRGGKWM